MRLLEHRKTYFGMIAVIFAVIFAFSTAQADWVAVGGAGLTEDRVGTPCIAIDSEDTPYLAFVDGANGFKASVMKYNGTEWVQVGNAGFSEGGAEDVTLALDSADTPYVAYRDTFGGGNAVSVMKYTGTAWVQVGAPRFTPGASYSPVLAIDSAGTPYVAYQCSSYWLYKLGVMKYNGTEWVLVGDAGFSPGQAYYISLAFDSADTLYVAYQDDSYSNKASVMKYDGTEWVQVGIPGFSEGEVGYTSLAFDSADTPYVSYCDNANSDKASVMKYDGTAWVQVGAPGFTTSTNSWYTSLAFDSADTPYVASGYYSANVMKYDGTAWVQVGSPGFSASYVYDTNLAFDSADTPYVAYRDAGNDYKATVMKLIPPAPTVSSVSSPAANQSYNSGSVIPIEVTFSEAVTVTGTPQLTLETGTTDAVVNYTSGSPGTTLTFSYTVADGHTSADLDCFDENSLALNGGTVKDTATGAKDAILTLPTPGATNSLGDNKAIVIDTTAPTVSLTTTASDPTNTSPFSVTVTFSEDVNTSGILTDGMLVSNGTIGGLSNTTPNRVWTVNITPASDGEVTVDLLAGAAMDAAVNNNTAATQLSRTYDGTAPTVTISKASGQDDPTTSTTINFTVVFSESVSNFATGDVTLGGTASPTTGTVSGSGTTYNVAVTGMTSAGTVTASISANVASDSAGNNNTIATFTDNTVNFTPPPPSVSSISRVGTTDAFLVTFSESVSGIDTGDFVMAKTGTVTGTIASVSAASGSSVTVTISGVGGDGTLGLNLADNDTITNSMNVPIGGTGVGNGNFTGQTYIVGNPAPDVTTAAAASVTSTSAVLGGNVTITSGGLAVTERGVCWNTSSAPTTANSKKVMGSGTGTFSGTVTGLKPNTTYHVRAYATNSAGTAYGDNVTLKSKTVMPTVTTGAISDVTTTSATGCGSVTIREGYGIECKGICWNTSSPAHVSLSPHTEQGDELGDFVSSVTGLKPDTTYYVRAYAQFRSGTSMYTVYGKTESFTTPPEDEALPGDVNGDEEVDLDDAIIVLKLLSGVDTGGTEINPDADVNGDGQIGIPEVIYILQVVSQQRTTET